MKTATARSCRFTRQLLAFFSTIYRNPGARNCKFPGILFFLCSGSISAQETRSVSDSNTSQAIYTSVKTTGKPGSITASYPGSFTDSASGSVNRKNRVGWVIAGNAAFYAGSLIALNSAWYKDYPRSGFHTFNDSREWLQVDKTGHAWTAYATGKYLTEMWEWAGLPRRKAIWAGGLSGVAYLTTIEFLDAYSAEWGWSWSDMAANVFGSALFMGQEFMWQEQRIQFKFSFHHTNYKDPMLEQRADNLFGSPWYERMLKDYNAQTYWFSANIRSFFKNSRLPAWLNVAAGYGGDGMFGGFENSWKNKDGTFTSRYDIPRKRQFYLAPDIDFTKIKTRSKFLRTTFSLLNAFKCPAPALMMDSKGKLKAYAIYF
jgi:hypothetical protein